MRLIRLLVLFSLIWAETKGDVLDTLKYSLTQKPKFFFSLASHNTFIDGQYASLGGVRIGLNYNQRLRFGIGYFDLTNNSVISKIRFDENDLQYETTAELYMHYFSLSAEYYCIVKYPWLFSVTPVNVAYGRAKYEYVRRPERKKVFGPSEDLILYQPEASVQFSILKWLGVGTTAGYRFTILRSLRQTQHLNAVAFSIDVRLSIDELFKEVWNAEHGEAGGRKSEVGGQK